jgi:hypothetical protein
MSEFPEHDRLDMIKDKSQTIGDFVMVFLPSKGIYLSTLGMDADTLLPNMTPIQDLLAEYFGIDRNRLDQEKLKMLDQIREANS